MANLKDLLTQKSVNLSLNLAPIYGKNHRRKEFSQNGYEIIIFIKSQSDFMQLARNAILELGMYYNSQKADIDSNQLVI